MNWKEEKKKQSLDEDVQCLHLGYREVYHMPTVSLSIYLSLSFSLSLPPFLSHSLSMCVCVLGAEQWSILPLVFLSILMRWETHTPGLILLDTEVKFLLCADGLVLLSPAEQGLQQNLDRLGQYCQNCSALPKTTQALGSQTPVYSRYHCYVLKINFH